MENKIIAYEYSRKDNSLFSIWDMNRIKNAFNFGHGTIKDFMQYANNNKNLSLIVFC